MMTYNGWKNYETWNVALWMFGDESIYKIAQNVANMGDEYHNFASIMFNDFEMETTPDGVSWDHPELDIIALNEALYETIA